MTKFQPPKGMKDLNQEEMVLRKELYKIMRKVLDSYAYQEVEPSVVEYFETLKAKSGEDVQNEIYDFKDKGGRRLGLRFDLTVGISRMVASTSFPSPLKLYAISNSWRYDNPQFGRYRSFYSWDAEIFGTSDLKTDAEIIVLSIDVLNKCGLKNIEVRINNRTLVEGLLQYLGIKKNQLVGAMRTIDKIEKLSNNELIKEFKRYGIEEVQSKEILNALKRKGSPLKVLASLRKDFPKSRKIEQGIDELYELILNLKTFNVLNKCVVDLSIVRGIDYYTGIVFEAYDKKNENIGSLFAGGRFDNLVGIYGKDTPAVGVGGGIERLIMALEKNKALPKTDSSPEFFVVAVKNESRDDAIKITQNLRNQGKKADVDLTNRKLGKQLEYANKINVKKVIIVGPKELKQKKVIIKDMKTGKEKKVSLNKL